MTVAELIDTLSTFPPHHPVTVVHPFTLTELDDGRLATETREVSIEDLYSAFNSVCIRAAGDLE
ncbi:MAG: hypothetical protein VB138_04005 [Burkholderia sp.]